MSELCSFDISKAKTVVTKSINDYAKSKQRLDQNDINQMLQLGFLEVKKQFENINQDSDNFQELIQFTYNKLLVAYRKKTGWNLTESLTIGNVAAIAKNVLDSEQVDITPPAQSHDQLTLSVEGRSIKEASDKFIQLAYGDAKTVKNEAVLEVKTAIFDACFLDRKLDLGFELIGNLNDNIRAYQQKLFDNIIDFLETQSDITLPEERQLFRRNGESYYATSALSELLPIIKQRLDPSQVTSGMLNDLRESNSKKDKLKLRAYNSAIFLLNFDNFMNSIFGDSLNINNFGVRDGSDKYSFKEKTANQVDTWRKDDNIFPEEEADKVVKLMIETTQMCDKSGKNYPGRYLTFQDFAFITSAIRLNITSNDYQNLKFENLHRGRNSLSQRTRDFAEGKTFAQIVSALRYDYQMVMPIISELYLSGSLDNLPQIRDLNEDQKLKLSTVMYKLFNHENNGIYSLTDFKNERQIYKNLCQTADSIFRNVLTQTFKDSDGSIYNRLLLDLSEYKQKLNIKSSINVKNAVSLQPEDFKNYFEQEFGFTKEDKSNNLQFKFPIDENNPNNFYIGLKVDKTLLNDPVIKVVKVVNGETQIIELADLDRQDKKAILNKIKELSDRVLGTQFVNDPSFWDNFVFQSNETSAIQDITKYCAEVLARIYVSNVDIKGKTVKDAKSYLTTLYGYDKFSKIEYDLVHKQVNLDGGKISNDILNKLAKAKNETLGLTTAASTNNSENKAQALQAFSKLLGSYGVFYELQEKMGDSVTQDLDFLKQSGLFVEVQIINEVYDKSTETKKDAVEMHPSEISAMNLLYDFIPALFETDQYKLTKNGIAQFIASVNSDKNTVDKLSIDLNKEIEQGITYRKADIKQIKENISKNLGTYYSNMLSKVYQDFETLTQTLEIFLTQNGLTAKIPSEMVGFDYVNNFKLFKQFVQNINQEIENRKLPLKKFTERSLITELLKLHNSTNPNNIVQLVSNIHVAYDKSGNLRNASNTLLAQVYRFGYRPSPTLKSINPSIKYYLSEFYSLNNIEHLNSRNWSTLDQFMEMRELELIASLISNNTIFNISKLSNEVKGELVLGYEDWIDSSDNLIIAKIKKGNEWINISSKSDYYYQYGDVNNVRHQLQSRFGSNDVQINPLLQKQNALHYLFTQQWMFTTVGSFVAHPLKSIDYSDYIVTKHPWMYEMFEESQQFLAQAKRNVAFTAQMQQFLLNDLYGVNSTYRFATVEDMVKYVDVLTSKQNKIVPFDGATYVDPFTMRLENASLAGNGTSSGETKKTFVHFRNPLTGNAGIIKTAVFALTNAAMLKSPDVALNIFYKMSENRWTDEQGNLLEDFDLTTSDLQEGLYFNTPENLYYTKNNKFYKIQDIEYKGNNNYVRTEIEVDQDGKEIRDENGEIKTRTTQWNDINSNVKAWELFGGLYAMEHNSETLVQSEKSITHVVNCMNHKGWAKDDYSLDEVKTQSHFYQPMKHSQINYIVTEGAIKHGSANVNINESYENRDSLNIQTFEMLQGGTQLDKEHHADFSEVSVPTQVISACAGLGISFYDADTLYDGIASIADIALGDMLKAAEVDVNSMNPDQRSAFIDQCMEIIVKNLASANVQNFGTIIANSIVETAKQRKNLNDLFWEDQPFPISDNTVFNRALNALANHITKNAIRLKSPGTLSIMTPSHKMTPIFGDRQWSDYRDPFKETRISQQRYDNKPVYSETSGSVADINLDYNYKIQRNEEIGFQNLGSEVVVTYNGINYNFQVKDLINLDQVQIYNDKNDQEQFGRFFEIDRGNTESVRQGLEVRAIYQAIREKTKNRRKQIRIESDEEYEIRINQEAWDEYVECSRDKFKSQIYHQTTTLSDNPDSSHINYHDLRREVKLGNIKRISEYIMSGRDLGSYNARFDAEVIEPETTIDLSPVKNYFVTEYIMQLMNDPTTPIVVRNKLTYLKDYLSKNSFDGFYNEVDRQPYDLTEKAYWDQIKTNINNMLNDPIKLQTVLNRYLSSSREIAYQLLNASEIQLEEELSKLGLQSLKDQLLIARENFANTIGLSRTAGTQYVDRFNIWDLASVQKLHQLKSGTTEYIKAERQMKRDLLVLSKTAIDLDQKLNEFEQQIDNPDTLNKLYVYMKLQHKLDIKELYPNLYSNSDVKTIIGNLRNTIANRVNVIINGKEVSVKVDRSSVTHQDFEIIMPKVFATTFGLKPGISLAQIKNNTNYFVEQNVRKNETKLNSNQYSIEIKRAEGKHIYIAIDNNINYDGFIEITNSVKQMIDDDGKIYRLDEKDNKMYEIKPGTRIFQKNGVEILVVNTDTKNNNIIVHNDNLSYYLKKFNGSQILLSESCTQMQESLQQSLLKSLTDSKWNKNFIEEYLDSPTSISEYIEQQNKIYKLTIQDVRDYPELRRKVNNGTATEEEIKRFTNIKQHPYFLDGREKYNAFIESLKVIAARIPAQSMQSFMAMTVVGFSDGDKNTAYVSDLQIFLQGSDFDIDSVTILTYDVNTEGKIDLWSPFAYSSTPNGLEISKTLPFPSGHEILTKDYIDHQQQLIENNHIDKNSSRYLKEIENLNRKLSKLQIINTEGSVDDLRNFFEKYRNLLIFSKKDGKFVVKYKIPKFSRNSEQLLRSIKDLLNEKTIYRVDQENNELISVFKELTGIEDITYQDIQNIFSKFEEIINSHNLYLKSKYVDNEKLRRIVNNSNQNSMYNIITDTANLSQSMVSVDSITDPVKELSKKSPKATNDYYAGPGNVNSIGEAIHTNYTGKDCIAKSAATIKAFFKLSHFYNKVLNSEDSELQKLLIPNQEILKRCGKYIPVLANIRAVDPTTIFASDVLNIIASAQSDMDFALQLSALLGLSADNAKELILDKINAGVDIIGLYLYGISIGFTIEQLSEVIMSDTARILIDSMQGDIFLGIKDKPINKIFDYFRFGPVEDLTKFHRIIIGKPERDEEGQITNSVTTKASSNTMLENVVYELLTSLGKDTREIKLTNKYGKEVNVVNNLINKIKNGQSEKIHVSHLALAVKLLSDRSREELNVAFNKVKNNISSIYNNFVSSQLAYQLIDTIKEFTMNHKRLTPNGTFTDEFNTLEILSIGSSSMQQSGSIIGLNKGIPSTIEDFMRKVNGFENYLYEQARLHSKLSKGYENDQIKKSELKISLSEFILNEEYRKQCIEAAEKSKVNFNMFALVEVLPDIRKYVEGLFIPDYFLSKRSSRYNYLKENLDRIQQEYRIKDDKELVRNISRFIQSCYIREFLYKSGFKFTPERYFSNGILQKRENTATLGLQSLDEIASFKYWMESKVIPDLKKNPYFKDNKFIQNMIGSSRNNTISRNEAIVYTLPINMMAKEGTPESILFDQYSSDFHKINMLYDDKYDVKELLFLYTLIAHEWRPGQASLVNLFTHDVESNELVKKYFETISELDKNPNNSEIFAKYKDEQNIFMATKNRTKNPDAQFILAYDPDLGENTLWEKNPEESDYDDEYGDLIDQAEFDYEMEDEGYGEWENYAFSIPGYTQLNLKSSNYYTLGSFLNAVPNTTNTTDMADTTNINDTLAYLETKGFFVLENFEKMMSHLLGPDHTMADIRKNYPEVIKIKDGKEVVDFNELKQLIEMENNNDEKLDCPPF